MKTVCPTSWKRQFKGEYHCIKSVRIRSYSGPYFSVFGLNTERHEVSLRIQSECGKMRTRITPNTNTFHAACLIHVQRLMKFVLYFSVIQSMPQSPKYIESIAELKTKMKNLENIDCSCILCR